jgi:pimeloyl-ACP methyl ester carboxylesterase
MTELTLPQGTLHVRDTGGSGPPIVFVHGVLVDGTVWRKVTAELAPEFRCIAPDWPLGSHPRPMNADADLTPRGVAHLIADALDALGLRATDPEEKLVARADAERLLARAPEPAPAVGGRDLSALRALREPLMAAFEASTVEAFADAVNPLRACAGRSSPEA